MSESDIWLEAPVITALTDAPVSRDTFKNDAFGLARTMGPVYDILRHPKTQTPLSIAIYGDWGSGKTTAMYWLEDRLALWREQGKAKDKVSVHTTWFHPWKYDNKQDVWRGLIAEIIIACLGIEGTTIESWKGVARDLGRFMGNSFLHMLSAVKLKGVGGELDMGELSKVFTEAREFVRPEHAYLNEFEYTLRRWLQGTLGGDDGGKKSRPRHRMVVFIDDLDRCLPDIALQVLEALKLYLNTPNLVFVLGVDDQVIKDLVREHYGKLGLDKEKSGDYLAKMFQVEVPIRPLEQQVTAFLENTLADAPSWKNLELDEKAQDAFKYVVLELANSLPREVKRLVNFCLMAGRGAQLEAGDATPEDAILFHLLRRVLGTHGVREQSMLTTEAGQRFFRQCAEAIRADPRGQMPAGLDDSDEAAESGARVPKAWRDVKEAPLFDSAWGLLRDERVCRLLALPFPSEEALTGLAATVKTPKGAEVLVKAIEEKIGKLWHEATDADFERVTELDISSTPIADLTPLQGLANLRRLHLTDTQVADLDPLARARGPEITSTDRNSGRRPDPPARAREPTRA